MNFGYSVKHLIKAAQGNTHRKPPQSNMRSEWVNNSADADDRIKTYEKNGILAEKIECGEKRKGYYIMIKSKDFTEAHKKGLSA
ncbi:hypothetical protein KKB3_00768 [Dehalococcoides mccartyi]|nr:hypothetical protein KKB3_00768 [Dehalococcoides mccartyi]